MLSVHAYTCGGKKLHDQQVSPEANVSRFPFIFFKLSGFSTLLVTTCLLKGLYRAPVAQLVEHRAVTREVVSSTPAGPNTQGL